MNWKKVLFCATIAIAIGFFGTMNLPEWAAALIGFLLVIGLIASLITAYIFSCQQGEQADRKFIAFLMLAAFCALPLIGGVLGLLL